MFRLLGAIDVWWSSTGASPPWQNSPTSPKRKVKDQKVTDARFTYTPLWGLSFMVLLAAFALFVWGAWLGGPELADSASFPVSAVGMSLLWFDQKRRRQSLDQPPPPDGS